MVELFTSAANQRAQGSVRRIQRLLQGFNQERAMLQLAVRGVSPAMLEAVQIEERDLANPANSISGVPQSKDVDTKPKYSVAPRVGISYPIGQNAAFSPCTATHPSAIIAMEAAPRRCLTPKCAVSSAT